MEELIWLDLNYCIFNSKRNVPQNTNQVDLHILRGTVIEINWNCHFQRFYFHIVYEHLRFLFPVIWLRGNVHQHHWSSHHLILFIVWLCTCLVLQLYCFVHLSQRSSLKSETPILLILLINSICNDEFFVSFWHFDSYRILVCNMIKVLFDTEHLQKEGCFNHNLSFIHEERNLFVVINFLLLLLHSQLLLCGESASDLLFEMKSFLDKSQLQKWEICFLDLSQNHRIHCILGLIRNFYFFNRYDFFWLTQLKIFIVELVLFVLLNVANLTTVK